MRNSLLVLGWLVAAAVPSAPTRAADNTAPAALTVAKSAGAPTPDSICTATAWCNDGSTVSCSGNSTCSATDANCPSTRGSVTCDGSTTYCAASCPGQCNGAPQCSSSKQCWTYCGGPGYGVCSNGCCYCY